MVNQLYSNKTKFKKNLLEQEFLVFFEAAVNSLFVNLIQPIHLLKQPASYNFRTGMTLEIIYSYILILKRPRAKKCNDLRSYS